MNLLWMKIIIWVVIAGLCFYIVWHYHWTKYFRQKSKLIPYALICAVIVVLACFSLDRRQLNPKIFIVGALPLQLWEKVPGPESVVFGRHRLGFIVKLRNKSNSAAIINLAVLEGCVRIDPLAAEGMLIEGEQIPRPMKLGNRYAALQQSAVQAIRVPGAIRENSREVRAYSAAYIGILFPLPSGRNGAIHGVLRSASIKGDCKSIKNQSSQPSAGQLFEIGSIHKNFPLDLAPQFRDGRLKLQLHVGDETLELDPSEIGKMASIRWKNWSSLDLARMYEVPDSDYPPILE